ncbi:hypothetical protein ScPMuIL_015223 [Solemya velum]
MSAEREGNVGWARLDSKLWTWGANSYGQLGQGHCDDKSVPVGWTVRGFTVGRVVCGGGHSLIITENGQLWSCGSNSHGQLGLGMTENTSEFHKIDFPKAVCVDQVAAGWDFTLASTRTGELYGWGSNAYGQLGLGQHSGYITAPVRVPITGEEKFTGEEKVTGGEKVEAMSAGLRHTVVLTDSGRVMSCGDCRKGQLGLGFTGKSINSLTQVTFPSNAGRVAQITAGAFHTAALTEHNQILIWGCNKYGQSTQDPKVTKRVLSPFVVDMKLFCSKVRQLRSGWTHLVAITDNNAVYSWGRGDYGQLGRSYDRALCHRPESVPGLAALDVCCGSEHNLAITENHELFAWGWNEHGMCGNGSEENLIHPQKIKILSDLKTLSITCGAGHSFAMACGWNDTVK